MAEVKTLAFKDTFAYKGIFDPTQIYRHIQNWFSEHNYDMHEAYNFEEVSENGKQIILKLEPYKKITDYAKIKMKVTMTMKNLKDKIIENNNIKHQLKEGDMNLRIDL